MRATLLFLCGCALACAAVAGCNPSRIDLPPRELPRLPDAGTPDAFVPRPDAGPRDAGSPPDSGIDAGQDAGPSCPVSGSCHPLFDWSCGCGYSDTTYQWSCGSAGSSPLRGACDTWPDCGPGLLCTRETNAARGWCRTLCDEDADCAPGSACARVGDSIACAGYCLPLSECSLVWQECGAGRGCYWLRDARAAGREHVFCNRAGTALEGDLCFDDPTACAPGLVCAARPAGSVFFCRRLCSSDADCVGGERCSGTAASYRYCY